MITVQRFNSSKQIKVYIIGILCLSVIMIFWYISIRSVEHGVKKNGFVSVLEEPKPKTPMQMAFKGQRIVHLDLKGAPPKISYYKVLFPLLAKLGATGVLIEYEDMFPYTGELINITALNCYSIKDIETINQIAKEQNLKVIPLVPTFGHLEFVLKLPHYQEYREVPEYPQIICPTYEKTEKLIKQMLSQIINAHPDSEFIHLGADEVKYLGVCERCNDYLNTKNLSKNQLFITYINTIARLVKEINPNLRILIWDGQLRSLSTEDLKMDNFNINIEPVIWKYSKDVYDDLGPSLWNNYKKVFRNVWIGSAFKGATGSNEIVSYVTHYLENHRSWMSVVSEYENQFNFQGILITGWQRYDHFSVLCELLPVGIPTLAMCIRLLLGYNDSPIRPPKEIAKILKCKQPYALIGPVFGSPKCAFLGGDILEHIFHFQQLKQEFEIIVEDSVYKGWLSEYNIVNCFSSASQVESVTSSLSRIREDLIELKSDLTVSWQKVYDEYTIDEWLQTYLEPLEKQVEALWNTRNKLLAQRTWSRRPLKKNYCDL